MPPTPRFFNAYALEYDFDPTAPPPLEWLSFLEQIWGTDTESIAALQEWFGYLLTPDTKQQKILMMVGPKRSGRGTIARVLKALAGASSVVNPTLSTLARPFGLASFIGKPIAVFPDARLSSRPDNAAIVECLLSISGEDDQTIDRKHHAGLDGQALHAIRADLQRASPVAGRQRCSGRTADHSAVHSIVLRPGRHGPFRPPATRAAGNPPLGNRRLGTVESTWPVHLQPRSAASWWPPWTSWPARSPRSSATAASSSPTPLARFPPCTSPGARGARSTAATPSATATRSAAICTRPFPPLPRSGPALRWAGSAITREFAFAPLDYDADKDPAESTPSSGAVDGVSF